MKSSIPLFIFVIPMILFCLYYVQDFVYNWPDTLVPHFPLNHNTVSSWFPDSYSYKEGKLYVPKTKEDLQKYVQKLKDDDKFQKIVSNS